MSNTVLTLDLVHNVIDRAVEFNDLAFCDKVLERFGRDITNVPFPVRLDLWRFFNLYRLNRQYRHYNVDVTSAVEIKLDEIAVRRLSENGYTVKALLGVELGWDEAAAHYWSL